jgi:tetratricopeptide (TPR) repeat protein
MRRLATAIVIGLLLQQSVVAWESVGSAGSLLSGTPCSMAYQAKSDACPEPAVLDSLDQTKRAANRLERAQFFAEVQDFEKARTEIDLALGIEPKNADALHLSARLWFTGGDIVKAEHDINIAREQSPNNPDVRSTYAAILAAKGLFELALREYHEIIRDNPHYRFARVERARMLIDSSKPEMALPDLGELIKDDPSDVIMLARRATVFLALGRTREAIDDYSAALDLKPGTFWLLKARVDAYLRAELDESALGDLDTLLGHDPARPAYAVAGDQIGTLLRKRAMVLAHMARFDDAADDMIRSVSEGGKRSILRAQIFLRNNGFPEVELNGQASKSLHHALSACFSINGCFHGIYLIFPR